MIPIVFLAIALTEVICFTASIVGLDLCRGLQAPVAGPGGGGLGFLGASLFGLGGSGFGGSFFNASSSFGPFDAWLIYNLFRAVCFGGVIAGFSLGFHDIASNLSRSRAARDGKLEGSPDHFVLPPQEKLVPWPPLRERENGVQH